MFAVGDTVNVLRASRLPKVEEVYATGIITRISLSNGTPLFWIDGLLGRDASVLRMVSPAETKPTARRYRVTLWCDVPLEEGENEDGTPDGVLYPQYTAKELEKHLIQVLRKAEPECDLEVMDYEDVEA